MRRKKNVPPLTIPIFCWQALFSWGEQNLKFLYVWNYMDYSTSGMKSNILGTQSVRMTKGRFRQQAGQ
jgi:hypothetical protein